MALWHQFPAKTIDNIWRQQAQDYQQTLTKPAGSLGLLESIAVQFSAYQSTLTPVISAVDIVVMAADHGVAAEGVSAFPQAVTAEMVKNFASGGAAIAVLARGLNARLSVMNLGTVTELPAIEGVLNCRIAAGTQNFCVTEAMTRVQFIQALDYGKQAAERAAAAGAQLFIGGDMGIANTTAAACVVARLLDKTPEELAGPGTGLDAVQIQHKATVIARALQQHDVTAGADVLQALGGFEIVALAGAYIACAQRGIPVLLDGYIATAAAVAAVAMNPSIQSWLLASHQSAEPAHGIMLQALQLQPLLSIGLRLGEGSGAAIAVPLLQAACRLQSEMATFTAAAVSEKL